MNRRKPNCHPNRKHVAKGLCENCYYQETRKIRRLKRNLEKYGKASKPQDTIKAREYHLKSKYGISLQDLNTLLEGQNNQCAICKELNPTHVDHDHETGVIRGILCHYCNPGLGWFRDNIKNLQNAINYLEHRKRFEL